MSNNHLVDKLVDGLQPVRPRRAGRDVLILAVVCLVELVLFLSLGAMRPDIGAAMENPSFWWKLGSLGVIALVGAAVAILSFDPVQSPRQGLRWLVGIVAAALIAGWFIDASHAGWPTLAARLNWQNGVWCVEKVTILSLPAMIGLGLLMRRGAPTDAAGTALSVGIAAAGWGAFVFVFACPYDDPLYIALWYTVGCGFVSLLARLLLPPLTRW
jgi:hypothetical protein